MSKPKLYIKNDKGRYEPYQLSEPDVSDTVYRKINGKYEPVDIWEKHNWLQEVFGWLLANALTAMESTLKTDSVSIR